MNSKIHSPLVKAEQRTRLFYPEVGDEVECTILRIVQGKYGRQPIAKIGTVEFFLPGHRQLVKKIEEVGLRKPISICLLKKGDATHEAQWGVREL